MPTAEAAPPTVLEKALAFKAWEIEELADRYFFRPAGGVVAWAGYGLGLHPNHVTVLGGLLGIAAGALLYKPEWGLWGFALLIVHSVFDSADGQLARITGKFSIEGRILDGLGGYATHIAMYFGIALGWYRGHHSAWIFLPMLASGLCNAAHASMYDYNRNEYIAYGIKGKVPAHERPDTSTSWGRFLNFALGDYEGGQRLIARSHARVDDEFARRYGRGGEVPEPVRAAYRRSNYWMVRGWNFLGDNTRFYAIGLFAWLGHLVWFFAFNLVVMNLALAVLLVLQARVDRAFLKDWE